MKPDQSLFDAVDDEAEARSDARAEADAAAGRTIGHEAVVRWLRSWGSAERRPRPRIGD